jgi:hypothetical protein
MVRAIRIFLSLLVLVLALWQALGHRNNGAQQLASELKQADFQIRGYVMTQDIEYLRATLLELHKQYWNMREEAESKNQIAFWCWVVVCGIGAGLLYVSLRASKKEKILAASAGG